MTRLAFLATSIPRRCLFTTTRWLTTTNSTPIPDSTSLDNDRSQWQQQPHCPVLQEALPKLQARFSKLAGNRNTFPILPPANQDKLYQRWNPTANNNDSNNNQRAASVLIALFTNREGIPSLLFTARSPHVPHNPSEISFPGGHQDAGDQSLEDTALRETQEELRGHYPWRDPRQLIILGRGSMLPSIAGTPVTPIIAVMMQPLDTTDDNNNLHHHFPGCEHEVEAVFGMSLQTLLETEESHELPPHPVLGKDRVGPRYPSPHGYIWGLTAFMVRPLLHKLFRPVFQLQR